METAWGSVEARKFGRKFGFLDAFLVHIHWGLIIESLDFCFFFEGRGSGVLPFLGVSIRDFSFHSKFGFSQ